MDRPRSDIGLLPKCLIPPLALVLTLVSLFALAGTALFTRGETLTADGVSWRLETLQSHAEFLRLSFVSEQGETRIEINRAGDVPPEEPDTPRYRVQPAPDQKPETALMAVVEERLRGATDGDLFAVPVAVRGRPDEAAPPSVPSVSPAVPPAAPTQPKPAGSWAYFSLNVIACGLFMVLGAWELLRRKRLFSGAFFVLACLAPLMAWFFGLPSGLLPAEWLSPLHEGNSWQGVAHLYGEGVHAGPNITALTHALTPDLLRLDEQVAFNLLLTVVNALIFLVFVYAWSGSCAATLVGGLLLLNVPLVHAAFSELPAPLLSLYTLMAALALAVLADRPARRADVRLAVLLLALVTVLLAATRLEFLLLGLSAWLWVFRDSRALGAFGAWLGGAGRRLAQGLSARGNAFSGAVLLALVAAWLVISALADAVSIEARWLFDGLFPFNPTILTAPFFQASGYSLLAVALLGFGVWRAVERRGLLLLVVIGYVVLYRMYFSASHFVFFELHRYMTGLSMLTVLLAVAGWERAVVWFRGIDPKGTWRGAATAGVILLAFTHAGHIGLHHHLFGAFTAYATQRDAASGTPALGLGGLLPTVHRNTQREVQFLYRVAERNPDCTLLLEAVSEETKRAGSAPELLAFGKRLPLSVVREMTPKSQGFPASASCVLFLTSLDCLRVGVEGTCFSFSGRTPLDADAFPSVPFTCPVEYGTIRGPVSLSAYRLEPGEAARLLAGDFPRGLSVP